MTTAVQPAQSIDYISVISRARRDDTSPWGILSGSERYGQRTLIEPRIDGTYEIHEFLKQRWKTEPLSEGDKVAIQNPLIIQGLRLIAAGFQHTPAVKDGVHAMYAQMPWLRTQFAEVKGSVQNI